MPRLSSEELATFLDEPGHILRLATIDADGAPRVVPIWFIAEAGRIWFTPRERSVWWQNLLRDPRASAVIDEEPHPYRKLIVRGEVRIDHSPGEDDVWRDLYRRIARRYVHEAGAEAYVTTTINERRALLSLPIEGETWRMPVAGEDGRGIWAERYYQATPRS